MAMRRSSPRINKTRTPYGCSFCDGKVEPNYKDTQLLQKFLTERGKMLSRGKTGVCSKHQRLLTREVKRSRFVALLPFVVRA